VSSSSDVVAFGELQQYTDSILIVYWQYIWQYIDSIWTVYWLYIDSILLYLKRRRRHRGKQVGVCEGTSVCHFPVRSFSVWLTFSGTWHRLQSCQ
jgi:hypothetical protein